MLANDLLNLRTQLRDAGIIFTYCGYVTEQVLAGVGDALKQKLLVEETDTKTARSVFAVFVEQMQNIIRYSAEKSEQQASPKPRGCAAFRAQLRDHDGQPRRRRFRRSRRAI